MRVFVGGIAAAVLGLLCAVARAKEPVDLLPKPAAPAPAARDVVVRGQKSLASAVTLCLGRVKGLGASSGVLVVVDVTDGTKAAKAELEQALAACSASPNRPTAWQVAALGGKASATVADPAGLGPALSRAFAAKPDPSHDTLGLLRRTLKGTKAAVVLYLAHAHFEDDVDLEGFIAESLRAKRTLCVIGSEAAFERPWNDVVADSSTWRGNVRTPPGQGNRPWGPEDPAAPWHGGDTAAPILPWSFYDTWDLEFHPQTASEAASRREMLERRLAPKRPPDPKQDPDGFDRWVRLYVTPPDRASEADAYRAWLEELGPPPAPDADEATFDAWLVRLFASALRAGRMRPRERPELPRLRSTSPVPLPSAFPPYGLARATGATGGCYVLWGWGTSDAAPTRYDYGRCGLFPPDLRARSEIYADYATRPLARALLATWTSLATEAPVLTSRSPPVQRGAPSAIEYTSPELAPIAFDTPADRDAEVAVARASIAHLARVRTALGAEVARVGDPKDDVDRRLRADADLLVHGLQCMEFQSGELAACAAAFKSSAWKQAKAGKLPQVDRKPFLRDGDDDLPVEREDDAVLFDVAAGEALVAARVAFLARYRGTPFGAAVAGNRVFTYGSDLLDMRGSGPDLDRPRPGRGTSKGPTPPAPPPGGGSSGTPGPTTGK